MEWRVSKEPVAYERALKTMNKRVADIKDGWEEEMIWLLEHPPLYTAGTSAKEKDLLSRDFPVFKTGRGGQYTYHGPGQRVAYAMLDLKKRQQKPDIKQYVHSLEDWIIKTLKEFDIQGERREGRIGIWVDTQEGEKKIAALGVRVRHWITLHGVSINVDPNLEHYQGIVPCGIADHGVTSMKDLGVDVSMQDLDEVLQQKWLEVFEPQRSQRVA